MKVDVAKADCWAVPKVHGESRTVAGVEIQALSTFGAAQAAGLCLFRLRLLRFGVAMHCALAIDRRPLAVFDMPP